MVMVLSPGVRAARGAALLDEMHPNWWMKIDIERLNIHSSKDCVLGQLFGNYMNEAAWPVKEEAERRSHGEEAIAHDISNPIPVQRLDVGRINHGFRDVDPNYVGMGYAWKQEIIKRRVPRSIRDFVGVYHD